MVEVAERQWQVAPVSGRAALPLSSPKPRSSLSVRRPTGGGLAFRTRIRTDRFISFVRSSIADEIRYGHLFLFVPVCLGSGAAIWFAVDSSPSALVLVASLLALLLGLFVSGSGTVTSVGLTAAALILAGMLLADWETRRLSTVILDQPVLTNVTGIVERREEGARGEWRYTLRLTATADPQLRRPPERVNLLARSGHAPAAIGDRVSGKARLSPPSGPALPGLNDFAFQSYFQGIGAVGFFLGPPQALSIDADANAGPAERFDRALFSLRDRISSRIRSLLPGDPGAFAASIITGERRSMSDEATDALRTSGLAHITAISGLNMALAAGIFFVGLRALLSLFPGFAQRYPVKKFAAAGALLATTGYVLISGYQVSALRAYLMTAIMLGAVLFDRPAVSLRNLALAATAILAFQPSAVMGPSFQMSFAATAALIAGYAGWRSRPRAILPPARSFALRLATGGAKFIGGTLATSLIGGLATAVFAITHFHRLSTHGLEANLAAMPLISIVVMPAGFIAMLLMPFGLDAPFFWIMGQGLELVLKVAYTVSAWGGGYVFPRLPESFMLGVIAGMLLLTLLRTPLRHAGTVMILATIAVTWGSVTPKDGELLISEDARLVALRLEEEGAAGLATNRTRPSAFIFDQWQPVLGIETLTPPAMSKLEVLPEATDQDGVSLSDDQRREAEAVLKRLVATAERDRFSCIKQACGLKLGTGGALVWLERADLVGSACDLAQIVILAARSRVTTCRSGALLISETTLRSTGAVELSGLSDFPQGLTIKSAFSGKPRPWTSHRLYDWRTGTMADSHDPIRPPQRGRTSQATTPQAPASGAANVQ